MDPDDGKPEISHRFLSLETIITTIVLGAGMVASFTLQSAKLDALTTGVSVIAGRQDELAERMRLHELLPIHPTARVEVDNLTRRVERLERLDHERPRP